MRGLALGMLLLVGAADPGPPPLKARAEGRVVPAPEGGWRFGWPGVYFEARFRGTGVIAVVEAGSDHLKLLVDGVEKAVLTRPGKARIELSGLAPGEHVVRLEKLTESQGGSSRLLGFYPYDNAEILPEPAARARAIEFIGDSHSVGYGDTSPKRDCSRDEVHDTTDTQQAFGPLLAKRLGADYRVIAYSGRGIVRNYDGSAPGESLPVIYDRALPGEAAVAASDGWKPQLIVINLGTNDFSTPLKSGEAWASDAALRTAWRDRYVAFVRVLRGRRPQARFVLMGADNFIGDVEAVAAALDPAGGTVAAMRTGPLELTGCDWHPSLADQRAMADRLAAQLQKMRIYMD